MPNPTQYGLFRVCYWRSIVIRYAVLFPTAGRIVAGLLVLALAPSTSLGHTITSNRSPLSVEREQRNQLDHLWTQFPAATKRNLGGLSMGPQGNDLWIADSTD